MDVLAGLGLPMTVILTTDDLFNQKQVKRMNDEYTAEKVHESGLPQPPQTQLAHHYVHESMIPVEDIAVETQDEIIGEQL